MNIIVLFKKIKKIKNQRRCMCVSKSVLNYALNPSLEFMTTLSNTFSEEDGIKKREREKEKSRMIEKAEEDGKDRAGD